MIVLLGPTGYIGAKLAAGLEAAGRPWRGLSRSELDYTRPGRLREFLHGTGATWLINAAGFTGKPNVDACETQKAECLFGNAVLPGILAAECEAVGIPWAHLSSGCIYQGRSGGRGFREEDPPNFDFRSGFCSWYSGTKALGEEILRGAPRCYVWRVRIPFEEEDNPRNYLCKLLRYRRLLDAENSLTHLGEFVLEALAMMERRAPFGVYNMTQPGAMTTREIVGLLQTRGYFPQGAEFFADEKDFMRTAASTPRSNCVLDVEKALQAGCRLTPIREKMAACIRELRVPVS